MINGVIEDLKLCVAKLEAQNGNGHAVTANSMEHLAKLIFLKTNGGVNISYGTLHKRKKDFISAGLLTLVGTNYEVSDMNALIKAI